MPVCDGRPPDGVCPDRKSDWSVCPSQGDLFLCEGCEHARFPDCSRKALKKKKAQSMASRQTTAPVSAGRSELSDDSLLVPLPLLLVGLISARKMIVEVTMQPHHWLWIMDVLTLICR